MDSLYLSVVFFIFLGLLYIMLSMRLHRSVEAKFNETYKNQLQKDIQEFYREMESYAALVESRINRYKSLVERHETILNRWQELTLELKKNKKTKEISDWIERSLEKEKQILETLSQISHPSSLQSSEIHRTDSHFRPTPKPVEPKIKIPVAQVKVTEKRKIPSQQENNHSNTSEFDFASEVLETYQQHQPTAEVNTPTTETQQGNSPLAKFGRIMFNLLLNQPPQQPKPSFPELKPIPPLRKNQPEKQIPVATQPPPAPPPELKTSPIVKKIDPGELHMLIERMRTEPNMRPALLKIMVEHNFPMPMVADLTGIELSQLEAIRKLYQI